MVKSEESEEYYRLQVHKNRLSSVNSLHGNRANRYYFFNPNHISLSNS